MNRKALILGAPSDAHTWNLFYLDLIMKESGYQSTILGGGLAYDDIEKIGSTSWDIIVVSSINGHFLYEAEGIFQALQKGNKTGEKPIIIAGGKLDVVNSSGKLIELMLKKIGYDEVFFSSNGIDSFQCYLKCLSWPNLEAKTFNV